MGGFSLWHWLIVGIVILLLFGKGRFSSMMGDVAEGLKSFKKGMADEEVAPSASPQLTRDAQISRDAQPHGGTVIDVSPAADGEEIRRP